MDMNRLYDEMKSHPEYHGMGMIASHLGIVRGTSLDGRKVSALSVRFNEDKIQDIIREIKSMDGIIHVIIEVHGGDLEVGDEVMAVLIGGDTREHVFPALIKAVNRVKSEAGEKTESF